MSVENPWDTRRRKAASRARLALGGRRRRRPGAAHFKVPPLPLVLDPGIESSWVDAELLDLPFGIAKPPPGRKLHADEGVGVASIVHRPYAHGALKGLLHH